MNIPLIDNRLDFDCEDGRYYRRAIWNTLLYLRPKYCLEIGTHIFQTAEVFSKYFEKYQPNGRLFTVDVGTFNNSLPPRYVTSIMVFPHIKNICDNHGGLKLYYKDYEKVLKNFPDASDININIIISEMEMYKIDYFDFTFVDGDHSRISFLGDMKIASYLTNGNGSILIDDINDRGHEQFDVYRELKEKGNSFYEYDNWNPNPGMGLIWNKELIL